ncbi:UDP-N-acetylmuramoyl-tripeptide--D-alanyl-D-alanine ligase [Streptomyces sannanensis]|uniref:UDP-N-acetylmuramoyl-tripeptide--D-alanyl-D-alanine ligase n=1 Tax=Streptomyces sannanensis TaxID=285536 RepID=A0ABP6S914_9ACTN
MITLTLTEIAQATGGTLHDAPDPLVRVTGQSASDSRNVDPGGMFVAVSGARVDGHDFVPQAITAGAVCVLASRPVGVPAVVVPDVTAALGRLAQHVLTRTANAQVVALTGSAGKTTTKDLLAQVLSRHGETVATPGSFNTEIGLPLTVLRASESTRYLILEMGARHQGDIAYLTSLTPPSLGIVLNIGSAHVGEFGSRRAIADAKSELVQALPPVAEGGVAVLNADDDLVAAMAHRTVAAVVTYGTGGSADIRATDIRITAGRATFVLHTPQGSASVALRLLGAHQVHNALAVAAAAHSLGMATAQIAEALSAADPVSAGRLQVLERADGVTIINDAFNANVESMRAGLHSLKSLAQGRRKVAVLGEMKELGDASRAAHAEIGRLVGELGIDVLVTVGTTSEAMALSDAARLSSSPPQIESAADPDGLLPVLHGLLKSGDVVLVKASRSVGLEHFADVLQADMTAA